MFNKRPQTVAAKFSPSSCSKENTCPSFSHSIRTKDHPKPAAIQEIWIQQFTPTVKHTERKTTGVASESAETEVTVRLYYCHSCYSAQASARVRWKTELKSFSTSSQGILGTGPEYQVAALFQSEGIFSFYLQFPSCFYGKIIFYTSSLEIKKRYPYMRSWKHCYKILCNF